MLNYANSLPRDESGEAMQEFPAPKLSVRRFVSENATTSSVITLSDQTSGLEIAAVGGTGFIKWVATSDTEASVISIAGGTANYDHVIPAGNVRRFVVPRETAAITSVAGVNISEGLYRRVAWKTGGVGSILAAEY